MSTSNPNEDASVAAVEANEHVHNDNDCDDDVEGKDVASSMMNLPASMRVVTPTTTQTPQDAAASKIEQSNETNDDNNDESSNDTSQTSNDVGRNVAVVANAASSSTANDADKRVSGGSTSASASIPPSIIHNVMGLKAQDIVARDLLSNSTNNPSLTDTAAYSNTNGGNGSNPVAPRQQQASYTTLDSSNRNSTMSATSTTATQPKQTISAPGLMNIPQTRQGSTFLALRPFNNSNTSASTTSAAMSEFRNKGLELWEQVRKEWLTRPEDALDETEDQTSSKQHSAIPLEVDEIIDVIFASPKQIRETGGLPRKFPQSVPLPQMVDILQDLWEAEGLDI